MRRRAGLAALAVVLAGCGRAPALELRVDARDAARGELAVAIEMRGAPRDSITFIGRAAGARLALDQISAVDPAGHPLATRVGADSATVEGVNQVVPTVTVAGPLPERFTLRYLVRPGALEGNPHVGFTGKRFGYVGSRFVFVTGRDVFLAPTGAESIRSVRVRFELPAGWQVEAPWYREGDGWRTGFGLHDAVEHLITASIGIGRFHERTVTFPTARHGGGTVTIACEDGIDANDRERAVHAMVEVAGYVDRMFGIPAAYLVVVVPETPEGDALEGEGWSTGQGGTLAPPTAARLELFARRLIQTRTTFEPFRTEMREPADAWLSEGITRLYSWRALAHAGWADPREIAEDYAQAYVDVLRAPDVEPNLERVYSGEKDPTAALEVVAPTALLCLDRMLSSPSAGPGAAARDSVGEGLDAVVRRVYADLRPMGFWPALPPAKAEAGEAFRRRFAQGREALPVETLAPVATLSAAPDPLAGPAVRQVTLVITGNTFGYLENCGCKVNQSGGMARRATAIASLRRRDPSLALLDAGNAFARIDERHRWDPLAREEQQVYLRLMSGMRYAAAAVGPAELAMGADSFAAVARASGLPYVAANVPALDSTWVRPWRVVRANGVRIGVIGLVEPPRGWSGAGLLEPAGAALAFDPPLDALRARVTEMRRAADLVVAIGRLRPAAIRTLVSECPGLDVVVSTDRSAVSLTTHGRGPLLLSEDMAGFARRTAVLYVTLDSYGLDVARLALDRDGRVAAALVDEVWLDAKVADDPQVRATLDRFYQGAGREAGERAQVPPLFSDDPAWLGARFAGATRCGSCHAEEYRQWESTPHASALKTLLDAHRHYQPRCVVCHVVGFGTAHGYRIAGGDLTLAGVQCEVCHGPGAAHAERPSAANIRRAVPERVCVTCHDPDHSDRFVYGEKLPLVTHATNQR